MHYTCETSEERRYVSYTVSVDLDKDNIYLYDFDRVLIFKIGRTSDQPTANWAHQEVSYLKNPLLGLLQQLQGKLLNESIIHLLEMMNPVFTEVNPDKPNIHFSSSRRPNSGVDKLEGVLGPLAEELCSQQSTFPLILIQSNLY